MYGYTDYPCGLNCFILEICGEWAMGQTSRTVTILGGTELTEVTTYDQYGDPIGTYYLVLGEKGETLKQAMNAARGKDKE